MVIAVKFPSRDRPHEACGEESHYRYEADDPVRAGMWIEVPAGAGYTIAQVTQVAVPDEQVCGIAKRKMRAVTELRDCSGIADTIARISRAIRARRPMSADNGADSDADGPLPGKENP